MIIKITARACLDKGIWDYICEVKGLNPYCINEGLMDSSELIKLNSEETKKLAAAYPLTFLRLVTGH